MGDVNKPHTASERIVGALIACVTAPILSGGTLTFAYAWGGMLPLMVGVVVRLILYDALGGLPLAVMAFLLSIAPSAFVVRGLKWQWDFRKKLRVSLIAEAVAALVAAAFLRVLLGGGTEVISEYILSAIDTYLEDGQALLTPSVLEDIAALKDRLASLIPMMIPAMFVSHAATDGILQVIPASWLMRRRGRAEQAAYRPMIEWRLPKGSALGLIAMLGLSYLLYALGMSGGYAVFLAVEVLVNIFFLYQAAGAFARFGARTNMPKYVRNIFLAFLLTLFQRITVFFGCFSALFGSQGGITTFIRDRREKRNL